MKKNVEHFIGKPSAWPSSYDDSQIDETVWSFIKDSKSAGDFACYLVHRLQNASYTEQAKQSYETLDELQPIQYFNAIEAIKTQAESGDSGAMFHLGKIFAIGIAVDQNLSEAERWYQRAVEHDDVRACCNLGWMYESGFGVEQDKAKAFELLLRGHDEGVLVAKATIAMMKMTGEGCQQDVESSIKLLEECFLSGYNNAANCLADMYFAGSVVEKDVEKGFAWLSRCAEKGDLRTMAIMGHYLVTGSHGKQDVSQGIGHLMTAVNMNYPEAHLWLGSLYEQGVGVDTNHEMAVMFYQKGASLGDEQCEFALARLASGALSPSETPTSIN